MLSVRADSALLCSHMATGHRDGVSSLQQGCMCFARSCYRILVCGRAPSRCGTYDGRRRGTLLWSRVPTRWGRRSSLAQFVGNAFLLEAGLAFLLGVQPPHPSWGNLIAGGRDLIVNAPWVAVAPGLALIATVCCCTLLGDAMRDQLAGERLLGERA